MAISFYNTLTRRKEPFVPRVAGKAGIYVCGMTVYDHCHIGHARVMVSFDVIVRHLRASGLDVTFVRNFTDIDDKILRRAQELDISWQTLAQLHIDGFHEDMAALGVARADVEPKATEHIAEMHVIIQRLEARGLAYAAGGDVYFAVDRFPDYGKLSGKPLDELQSGARVEVDERKRNPLDFVLWKGAKPGEPQWESPWGPGRPGWHIECSAMSGRYLGESFDLHGGGMDLIFPHHENEIAQSEGACGHGWVNGWLHNGFVNVVAESGERVKMSKSLGNFRTIRDLLAVFPGEALRMFILNSHYRSPLDFSGELLETARAGMDRIYGALRAAQERLGALPGAVPLTAAEGVDQPEFARRFFEAMDDDFNTPQALAVVFELAREVNRGAAQPSEAADARALLEKLTVLLRRLGANLGLGGGDPVAWFQAGASDNESEEIASWIARRNAARKAREFAEADRIRRLLAEKGILLEDGKDGTTWRRG
ncbi:MAG: cysteine--tRNA ligase [Magnetococcales bacterium]|nr:cysteine--tRNA ligase [Magnetococcales bacterium]